MKNVTIKDIAKQLGVSTSTVSRALRDSYEIGEETKKKVLALAESLDYNPNPVALNLLGSLSNDIGVIVPDIANPFFALVIAGIEDVAFSEGFHVIIYQSHDNYEREILSVKHVHHRRKDGLLVALATGTKDYSHFKSLHEKGFPIVFFDRICDEIETHRVSVDDFEGAYKATEHLIEQGCRKIAAISGPEQLLINKRRMHGFRAAMFDYKIPMYENLIIGTEFNPGVALNVTRELLKNNPGEIDAIFAFSDNIGLGCHAAIIEKGLRMPEDIALIGFSDLPISALLNPPLSSISQPAFEMGRSAASLLINQIRNPKEEQSPISNVLKTGLVVRGSSSRKTSPKGI